jgi:hypothetical protein
MNDMKFWCIYKHPEDYPDKYVVRRWVGLTPDEDPLIITDTIEEARTVIPEGTIYMGQDPIDPVIVEVYI